MTIKCLCFKTHANASKICVKKHNRVHTYSIKTQPANTTHEVCLGYTHSNMKQFLSLLKFKWLNPLNTQHNIQPKTENPNSNSNPNAQN